MLGQTEAIDTLVNVIAAVIQQHAPQLLFELGDNSTTGSPTTKCKAGADLLAQSMHVFLRNPNINTIEFDRPTIYLPLIKQLCDEVARPGVQGKLILIGSFFMPYPFSDQTHPMFGRVQRWVDVDPLRPSEFYRWCRNEGFTNADEILMLYAMTGGVIGLLTVAKTNYERGVPMIQWWKRFATVIGREGLMSGSSTFRERMSVMYALSRSPSGRSFRELQSAVKISDDMHLINILFCLEKRFHLIDIVRRIDQTNSPIALNSVRSMRFRIRDLGIYSQARFDTLSPSDDVQSAVQDLQGIALERLSAECMSELESKCPFPNLPTGNWKVPNIYVDESTEVDGFTTRSENGLETHVIVSCKRDAKKLAGSLAHHARRALERLPNSDKANVVLVYIGKDKPEADELRKEHQQLCVVTSAREQNQSSEVSSQLSSQPRGFSELPRPSVVQELRLALDSPANTIGIQGRRRVGKTTEALRIEGAVYLELGPDVKQQISLIEQKRKEHGVPGCLICQNPIQKPGDVTRFASHMVKDHQSIVVLDEVNYSLKDDGIPDRIPDYTVNMEPGTDKKGPGTDKKKKSDGRIKACISLAPCNCY